MRSPNSCEKQLKYSAMVEGTLMMGFSPPVVDLFVRQTNGDTWYALRRGGNPLPHQLPGFQKHRARCGSQRAHRLRPLQLLYERSENVAIQHGQAWNSRFKPALYCFLP